MRCHLRCLSRHLVSILPVFTLFVSKRGVTRHLSFLTAPGARQIRRHDILSRKPEAGRAVYSERRCCAASRTCACVSPSRRSCAVATISSWCGMSSITCHENLFQRFSPRIFSDRYCMRLIYVCEDIVRHVI